MSDISYRTTTTNVYAADTVRIKLVDGVFSSTGRSSNTVTVGADEEVWSVAGTDELFSFQMAQVLNAMVNITYEIQHGMGMSPFDCGCPECESVVGALIVSCAQAHGVDVAVAVLHQRARVTAWEI